MPRNTKNDRYIVYKHTNRANGKVYIGITSNSVEQRSGSNGKNYAKNKYFSAAIKKYGWSSFDHDILFDGLSYEEAAAKEVECIAKYRSNDFRHGYNLSSGGEGGNTGCVMSDSERARRSAEFSGANNPCYGKFGREHPAFGCKHSDMSKEAVRAALTGRVFSSESIAKMSDTRKKMGAWAGEKNPMSGKTYGNAPQARMVICLDTGVVYDSVKRAAESVGVAPTKITACCKGRNRTCASLHWAYKEMEGVQNYAS